MIRVAINGYGRVGRSIVRAVMQRPEAKNIEIVAINDPADLKAQAHLTEFDSVHGRLNTPVKIENQKLVIGSSTIASFQETNLKNLPWKALGIDLVMECSGRFCSKEAAKAHLDAGAKKVLVSAPTKGADATIVFGVNEKVISQDMSVISNASCTTNCLAPLAQALNAHIGIESGVMTTIHAYTNDQCLSDSYHADLYRCRAAALNMIPTKTGAAEAVGLVIPELQGKLTGMAVRVPTANVSLIDCCFVSKSKTSIKEVNHVLSEAAENNPHILQCNDQPLVSSDFNHNPASSIFDLTQTKVLGNLVKVMSWYDNEWGFSNRMIDTALYWHEVTSI